LKKYDSNPEQKIQVCPRIDSLGPERAPRHKSTLFKDWLWTSSKRVSQFFFLGGGSPKYILGISQKCKINSLCRIAHFSVSGSLHQSPFLRRWDAAELGLSVAIRPTIQWTDGQGSWRQTRPLWQFFFTLGPPRQLTWRSLQALQRTKHFQEHYVPTRAEVWACLRCFI